MSPLLDAVDLGVLVVGDGAKVEFANRWVADRLQPDLELVGQRLTELDDRTIEPRLVTAVLAALAKGQSKRLSHAFHPTPLPLFDPDSVSAERLRQTVDVIAQPSAADGARRCLVQVRDMTEIVRREQQLKEQARRLKVELDRVNQAQSELERQSLRFRELARLAPVGLLETDAHGLVCFFNDRAARMLAMPPDVIGAPWLAQLPLAERGVVSVRWQEALATGHALQVEVSVPREGDHPACLRLEGRPIGGAAGKGLGHIITLTDVSDLRESARRHEHRANHDALTGVPNRARLTAALQEAIDARDERIAVLFIDLDRFKPVNDQYGHAAGDAVLAAVGERLQRTMRAHDTVGRLGGDEFGVVVRHAPADDELHGLVLRVGEVLAEPVLHDGHALTVGASIGVAIYPADGRDAKTLLDTADQAMYRRKLAARGGARDAAPAPEAAFAPETRPAPEDVAA